MPNEDLEVCIRHATSDDVPQVKALLERYHSRNLEGNARDNGFVTTDMSEAQLCQLIETEQGVTVAQHKNTGEIVALLLGASWDFLKPWPMFEYMQDILDGYTFDGEQLSKQASYQYGPICIAEEWRSLGIGERLLAFQRKAFAKRFSFVVTFVNQVNRRSYAFHRRVGFAEVGLFSFNSNVYHMLVIPTE